jgi:type I restriction enzyme S subunit
MQGTIPYWGANTVVDYVDRHLIDGPLVLLGEDGAPFFDRNRPVAFAVNEPIWPNNHIHVLRPERGVDHRFLAYALNVVDYVHYIDGATRDKLTQSSMLQIKVALPPHEDQIAIASYLDAETARLDGLIAEKRKLLTNIEEMESALRFELATKGLNPSVRTAASGIEWVGSIPAHWVVKRNMFLFQQRREEGVDGLPILKVSLHTGVSEGEEDDEGTTRVRKQMEDKTAYQIVRKGDVAYNMMRAWQGAVGAVPIDGLVSPAYVVLEPSEELDARYFEMLARTPQYMKDFERYSYGIASFRWRLYWEGFKEIRTPVPSMDEQRAIVEAFESRRGRFRDLRAHIEKELEALVELRSATITDAVLGRIQVEPLT